MPPRLASGRGLVWCPDWFLGIGVWSAPGAGSWEPAPGALQDAPGAGFQEPAPGGVQDAPELTFRTFREKWEK